MTKLIVNVETGEETLIELTKAEKDQQKLDEAKVKASQLEAEAKEASRQAIADRLGLTADDLKALLG
jgi:phage terminase Nu1 subunit (DNA packaging protein)